MSSNGRTLSRPSHAGRGFLASAPSLLAVVLLAGCSVAKPLVETTAAVVLEPLPLVSPQAAAQRACRGHTAAEHGDPASLDHEADAFLLLADQSLVYRAKAVRLHEELRAKLDRNEPLSGRDLERLNRGGAEHLALRKALFAVAEAHECWLDADPGEQLPAQTRLKGVMLSLAAALVLYDNYLQAISLFQADTRLRQHLNNKDVGYGIDYGELDRIALSFTSAANRQRVRRGINFYEREIARLKPVFEPDAALRNVDLLIVQSPSYNMTRKFSPLAYVGNKLGFYVPITADSLFKLKDEGINLMSMLFGNAVGLVESRRGKLYDRPEVYAALADTLRAGDILLEKTPFRLTDAFIPGHWGHAAIWIGDEEELRALGVWEHPVAVAHHDAIRQGRRVVEALRSGVEMNTLRRFLNVDDVALLRLPGLSRAARAEVVLQALRQIGKGYDFNFDVQSTDRIVCSELVYHAYADLPWPTDRVLGRATISPDRIAERAIGDGPFDVLRLYHDGKPATDEPRRQMALLVSGRATPPASPAVHPPPTGSAGR